MFNAGTLTFQEFLMQEPVPLVTIQRVPELKEESGPVADQLRASSAESEV